MIAIPIAAAAIRCNIGQYAQANPYPVETGDAAGGDQHIHQGGPGQEDQAKQGPDKGAIKGSAPHHRPGKPPDGSANTRAQKKENSQEAAHVCFPFCCQSCAQESDPVAQF